MSDKILITDPRAAAVPSLLRATASLLNDPRDVVFVSLMLQCGLVCGLGIGLFFSGAYLWYLAPLYWLLVGTWVNDRFILMLHCTSHRPLFKPRFRLLGQIIPWLLGPFFGETPETYFVHHMGMHHREENLENDLSSTMRFRRDRFSHWLRYYLRFMTLAVPELALYHKRKGNRRMLQRLVVGEGMFWVMVATFLFLSPGATIAVFIIPVVVIRTLMMIGNWGQHAFVCPEQPENPFRASITCINTRYNRRCFNDGYHIHHHIEPRRHYTELPAELERNIGRYGSEDAIVFEGIDFFAVWLFLMLGRWQRLARAFVRLPGAPARSEDEVIKLLQSRMIPIIRTSSQVLPKSPQSVSE